MSDWSKVAHAVSSTWKSVARPVIGMLLVLALSVSTVAVPAIVQLDTVSPDQTKSE